ncbi:hypothetical protein ACWA06_02365 [Serratia rhizosphaerae]|uniref:Uncharacterized protein n=1 Tax=Serratia rhizosphaerae TaxID=2597702 RepID=A0ABX6GH91_9GAMM|nr:MULTISPECIES: hypothetical protein [Serratia]MBU3891290.1 hypothetical protein [Serratia rubidaea]AVJ17263.1 hypothetical protein CLM71_09020 [Serratia sp. MYb239]MEB6335598.1 hypothetical protein [Serratia rhizosphaerae]QHA85636.1 hypothetical protein FO014_00805 [Serratia rhizosphaerae]QNK30867.1 hypothetical protein HF675_14550 [Serratia sp. JUb9]
MALDKEKSEEAMTFGELLTVIADQKRRLSVLEVAFSYLAFGLDDKANQLLIHSLKLEAQNQNRDAETQQHFAQLAAELEKHLQPPAVSPAAE